MEQIFKHPNNINNLCLLIQTELTKNNIHLNKNIITDNLNSNINQIFSKFNTKKAVKDKYNIYLKQLNNKVIQKSLSMLNNSVSLSQPQSKIQQTQQIQKQKEMKEITNENDFFNPVSDIEENLDNQFNLDNSLMNMLENYEQNPDTELSFEEKMKRLENERSNLLPDEKPQNLNFSAEQNLDDTFNFSAQQIPQTQQISQTQQTQQIPQTFNFSAEQTQNKENKKVTFDLSSSSIQHQTPQQSSYETQQQQQQLSYETQQPQQQSSYEIQQQQQQLQFSSKEKLENETKLNEQMITLNKQISANNQNYEKQILLLNTIKSSLEEINQLQLKYTNSFPEKYIIDSRKLGDKYVNNYSFQLNEPQQISQINFMNMILPYKSYNIYKSTISYKIIETDDIRDIHFELNEYKIEDLEKIFNEHEEIKYDKEKNKFIYDKEKIEFIESDITEQLGLTNDSEVDLNNKKYLDFYINDIFVEKVNIQNFIPFKIDFSDSNETEKTQELIFSFYEENSQSLHEFNNYHLIEFIIS